MPTSPVASAGMTYVQVHWTFSSKRTGRLGTGSSGARTSAVMPLYVGHMEFVGILNGCRKKLRIEPATIAAMTTISVKSVPEVSG